MFQLDPAVPSWSNLTGSVQGQPPSRRAYHGLASAGGMVYLFGGSNPNGKYVTLPLLRKIALTKVPTAAGIVYGGLNDLHSLDPATVTWRDITALSGGRPPTPRCGAGFSSAGNWMLLVFGGCWDCSVDRQNSGTVWLYSP